MSIAPASLRRFLLFRWRPSVAIAVCGLLGTILPAAYGLTAGIPESGGADESSYLLAADTFAHGRLTNPTPELPEFFEAHHILVVPSYTSKYPPGQGLALAVGQVLFGHPIWGVWLGCGFFAASLCWMLLAWTSRPWAIVTTVFAIALLGVSSYWAQSYWGGMLPACGGALLFGGLRRTLRHAQAGSSLLMGLGVVVLASTRPFEGLLACFLVGAVLCRWLFADSSVGFSQKLNRWILPFGAMLLAGGAANAMYNRAVTGNWTQFPYSIYQRQYFLQDAFIFSTFREPERQPLERITKFYVKWSYTPADGVGLMAEVFYNFRTRLLKLLRSFSNRFELHVADMNVLWMGVLLAIGLRSRWAWFCAISVLFVILGQSTIHWWLPHYSAPIVPLVMAIIAEAFRRMGLSLPRNRKTLLITPLSLIILSGFSIVAVDGAMARLKQHRSATMGSPRQTEVNRIASRQDVFRCLNGVEGKHLVFIHYDDEHPLNQDWVYNAADFDAARLIFANDLGDAKNRELIKRHPDRAPWFLTVSKTAKELARYPSTSED